MRTQNIQKTALRTSVFLLTLAVATVVSAQPAPKQILQFKPTQADVLVETPTEAADVEACRVEQNFKDGDYSGFSLVKQDGTKLRDCCGLPGATTVEQIRYYNNGIEVFRETLKKECRWLNSAGSRRGILGANNKIVQWTSLSPEEATAEMVAAIVNNDLDRYKAVALNAADIQSLGLSESIADELSKQVQDIDANFAQTVQTLKIPGNMQWGMFNGHCPALIPAGRFGLVVDLPVYYNANVVVIDDPKKTTQSHQLYIGDLVKIGDVWKIVGLPSGGSFGDATNGENSEVAATSIFFPVQDGEGGEIPAVSGDYNELVKQLGDSYKLLETASPQEYAAVSEQTVDLMIQIASKSPNDELDMISQAASLIVTAIQRGVYPQGTEKLAALYEKYKGGSNQELASLLRLRQIEGEYYAVTQQSPPPKRAELDQAQDKYDADLVAFVDEYPRTSSGATALMYLALNQEYLQDPDAAAGYYKNVAQNFSNDLNGQKAAGAVRRLQSTGKTLPLPKWNYIEKGPFGLIPGKKNVVFCWASWSPTEIDEMVRVAKKFSDLAVHGVNFDVQPEAAVNFLKSRQLPWKNVCEAGGLDGVPAIELGVQNVPLIILFDEEGKVVNPSVLSVGELEMILDSMK